MKGFLAIGLLAAASSPLLAQIANRTDTKTSEAEQEVMNIDRAFDEALGGNDAVALDRLIADECIFTNDRGVVFGEEYRLNVTRSSRVVFDSYSADDVRMHVYGDTAVVTERNTTRSKARDQSHTGQFRYTRGVREA